MLVKAYNNGRYTPEVRWRRPNFGGVVSGDFVEACILSLNLIASTSLLR
jgi:hypothetical protein